MELRPDALIPLVGALVNMALAIFVFLQSPRSTVGRVFFLLGASFAIWNFGTYRMFIAQTAEQALFWARFIQFGVVFIPPAIFHLSFLIAGFTIPRRIVLLGYGIPVTLALSNFTSLLVADVTNVGYAWYTVGGPLFYVLFFIFGLAWLAVFILWRHRRNLPPLMRRRLTPLIISQAAIALFGSNDALPIVGIYKYPLTDLHVYPFGSMAAISYGLIVGYSVLQHQLLNVHVVLGRYAAHIVRMLFLFLIGFCLLLVVAVMTRQFNSVSFFGALGVLVVSTIIASTVFPKLLGGASEDFERRLLGDRFEYQEQVRSFVSSIAQYGELPRLVEDLHQVLVRTVRLESYRLILRDEVTRSFSVVQAYPEEPVSLLPDLRPESPVFDYFANPKHEYLSIRAESVAFPHSAAERRARSQLTALQQDLCFPLIYHEEPLGLLLAGRKVTQDPFTATDVRLLSELARNISAVLNNIRLKTQINQAQELDLLGRMSRGMAHDINNLLTPISTLLQLSEETGILDDELRPVAMRNLESIRAYIREALFFSEHLRPDIQPIRLDVVVRKAIEVASNSRTKQVAVVPQFAGEVPVEADAVLVQRLIANLITNAIDASPEGRAVTVSLDRLARLDEKREWLRVRIIDQGEGIPAENLNRIFTPYYTTKDRGDRERGFGLGLSICRKIAALHGGNLSIESQVKKGTTVQLDLPSRQSTADVPPKHAIAVPTAA